MNPARPSSDKQRLGLKMASQIATNMCGGGKIAAGLTDVNATTLSLYAAPQEIDRYMRIDVALDLDMAAGEPVMARALASMQGYELKRMRPASSDGELSQDDLGQLIREAADVQTSLCAALSDRKVTPAEKRKLMKELADLRQVLSAIEAKVEAA